MDQESLKTEYADFRDEYLPKRKGGRIKVLFVAESPPEPNRKNGLPYFYKKETQGTKGALWRHLSKALYGKELSDKEKFLRRFQNSGYFLIDVFETKQELNGIIEDVKKGEYKNAVRVSQNLFDRILKYNPDKVVFLGKRSAKLIAGCLPFGSETNIEKFKKFIRASVNGNTKRKEKTA